MISILKFNWNIDKIIYNLKYIKIHPKKYYFDIINRKIIILQ